MRLRPAASFCLKGGRMDDATLAQIQKRLRRVERQNRILMGLLCAALVVGSIAATHAAPNVIVADEVRAKRFSLLDPYGRLADDWYTDAQNAPPDTTYSQNAGSSYSRWSYHRP
jgi:hypothetical protein